MLAVTQIVASTQDWISDFWMCKTAISNPIGSGIAPAWDPPTKLDDWPTLSAELLQQYTPEKGRLTN